MVGRPHCDRGAVTASASSVAPLSVRDFRGSTAFLASGRLWNIERAAVPPKQMSDQRVLPVGLSVFEHFLGKRTADGIYAVGDDNYSGVNAYSQKRTNFVRTVPAREARMPAPGFFATRRPEEALRSVIHRGFLASCSAAIKPLPLSEVAYARLLIEIVNRYSSRRADGTADEFRTLLLMVTSGSAAAGAIPARCLCLELKEREVDEDGHLVLQQDHHDYTPNRRAFPSGGPVDCGAPRINVHFDFAGKVVDEHGAKNGATLMLSRRC